VTCPCCSSSHNTGGCPKFRSWSLDDRNSWAHDNKVCYNCLSGNHWIRACTSKSRCQKCSKKHHTLFHGAAPVRKEEGGDHGGEGASCCAAATAPRSNAIPAVLLGTALVHVQDRSGTWQTVRTLVDSASQIGAMTVAISTCLGLLPSPWTMPVSGISGAPVVDIKGIVECHVQPHFTLEPALTVQAWVFPAITSDMPRTSLPVDIKNKFSTLTTNNKIVCARPHILYPSVPFI